MKLPRRRAWCALISFLALPAAAQEPDHQGSPQGDPAIVIPGRSGGLADGPATVAGQLEEDTATRELIVGVPWIDGVLGPYFDWKNDLREKIGLSLGGDYSAVYQVATASPGKQEGAAGMWRFFGAWELVEREGDYTGSLVFKGENRHRYGSGITPLDLGFEIGSAVPTGVPFSDADWLLTNLFWKQQIAGRATLMFGQVDPTDYLDVYGLINPWVDFTNLAFLTNPTIAAPNQGLGAAAGVRLSDHFYLVAGFSDPNADANDPFDDFFSEGEFFTHGEIGWTSAPERSYYDNFHITGWHVDERVEAGVPEGWGLTFSGTWFFDDRWMPFVRAGYSDGGGALLEGMVAIGFGMLFRKNDLLGIGLSWGRPQADRVKDQYTTEFFYRVQLLPSLAITPDVQLIIEPPFNPERDAVIAVFGVRARLAF
jgi:porin